MSHAKPPLGRLIRVGGGAERDDFVLLEAPQLIGKARGVKSLGENPALELERVAQFHELMRIARIAVLAPELATAIGIDSPAKRQAHADRFRQEAAGLQI